MTLESTLRNLPHASYLCRPQNTVSVKKTCKTVKTETVENTVRMGPRGPDEEPSTEAACCVDGGGIWDPFAACTTVYILATLRHFDIKSLVPSNKAH